ncbi:MAG: hypothetical protein RIA64_07080 [Rhodospirillales bacterium]
MTDSNPKRNVLNAGEGLVLRAIREWRGATPESTGGHGPDRFSTTAGGEHNVPPALSAAVDAFLDLLWRCDPFIVNFNPVSNNGMTLFELQAIYALGEWRRGNKHTVHELLAWWFPDVLISHGRSLFAELSEVLDDMGIDFQPSKWVHAHFFGARARGQGAGSVVPTGTRLAPPGVLWASRKFSGTTH